MSARLNLRLRFTFLILLPAASGWAQTVAPAKPATTEDVVELSKFEVSATANRGYVTTSSMSASRIAVPITELPASVVVINEKLIADTVAFELRDTLSLVSGIQQSAPPQGSNEISMRGYTLVGAQRDGVRDHLMSTGSEAGGGFDYSLAERIEVVKGPSGVLYGAHNPGGILNIVSKRPLSRPRTRISAFAGSWETYRAELDTSNFFDSGKRFGYRLVVAAAETEGVVDDRPQPDGGLLAINPSLSFRSKDGWNVWVWSAIVRDELRRATYGVPALPTDANFAFPARPSLNGAPLYEVAYNHMLTNLQSTDANLYEVGVSKGFDAGPVRIDVRLLGREFHQRGEQASRILGVDAFDILIDRNSRIIGQDFRAIPLSAAKGSVAQMGRAAVRYDYNPFDTEGRLGSADVNFTFKIGPVSNQLLAYGTIGYRESLTNVSNYDIRNAATLRSLGYPTIDGRVVVVFWPRPVFVPTREQMVQLSDTRTIGRDTLNKIDDTSYGAIERLSFWQDRIILVGGYRHDKQESTTQTFLNGAVAATTRNDDNVNTYSISALGKIYKGERGEASVFINANETFIPVTTIDRRLATFGQKYPNRSASNDEYGVKLDLLQSRLVATLSIFKTTETNVLVTENDETGRITGVPSTFYQTPVGTRTTKGWEVDLNFAPLEGLELILAYSKVDPRLETGNYAQKIAFNTFTSAVRYDVRRGWAKGFSAMWQYNRWGRSALSSRSYWIIPGGDVHTAILGYRFGQRWTARLRVENVLDQLEVYPSTNETALDITRDRNYRLGITWEY
jgi:outer membrane receptor for ferric coprogen and ferric-rhodotorulic acid